VTVHLYQVPIVFVLGGLVLYVVLGGADYGAGFWQLTAGRGERAERIRELAHDATAAVWEANHVWLIFVLTVTWTSYPRAFGSLASTLSVALFVAALGIIARGALYALRSGSSSAREQARIDTAFGLSSVIAPFALGAALGGIASERVPVGNAAGHLFSSWLNPTSVMIGVLSVATGAYLAAVFLCADARRIGDEAMEDAFRGRALLAGAVAGGLAVVGLVVLHGDAHRLYHGLVAGNGLPALIVSGLAGATTLGLVWARRFAPARFAATLAVAAIIAGFALAQSPQFLPGLTVRAAAAPHDTLVAVTVAVIGGGVILFPALGTLFRLALGGRFDPGAVDGEPGPVPGGGAGAAGVSGVGPRRPVLLTRVALAALVAGIALVNAADSELAHGIGALFFVTALACGFRVALVLPAN
jgi:cytochrome d ubiquinol oxidase subunit II